MRSKAWAIPGRIIEVAREEGGGFVRVGPSDKKQLYAIRRSKIGSVSSRGVLGFVHVFCGIFLKGGIDKRGKTCSVQKAEVG